MAGTSAEDAPDAEGADVAAGPGETADGTDVADADSSASRV